MTFPADTTNWPPALADVKTWLSISSTADDAILTGLLNAAKEFINRETGIDFKPQLTTRYFGIKHMSVDRTRLFTGFVESVDEIWHGGAEDESGATEIPSNEVILVGEPYAQVIALDPTSSISRFRLGQSPWRSVQIAAKWSPFASPPLEVTQLCIELAAWMYRTRDSGVGTDIVYASRAGALLAPSSIPPHLLAQIRGWRMPI